MMFSQQEVFEKNVYDVQNNVHPAQVQNNVHPAQCGIPNQLPMSNFMVPPTVNQNVVFPNAPIATLPSMAPMAYPINPIQPVSVPTIYVDPVTLQIMYFVGFPNGLPMNDPLFTTMNATTNESVVPNETPKPNVARTVSFSVSRETTEVVETMQSLPEEKSKPVQKRKKYPHRSKQNKIDQVHAAIKDDFEDVYTEKVLRGEDTVRVHVKNYEGLGKIKNALDEISNHFDVEITDLAAPFSMKNKWQKKGFIVYLKLGSPEQVPIVQGIFHSYKFTKCDVARPKTALPQPINQKQDKPEFSLDIPELSKSKSGQMGA